MVTEFSRQSPRILELKQHVADLIAAGEVVQRPASVVKELIENSIDSGAGIITAEITTGGMTYIRVTDNGCGIAAEDVKTAFLRHATSKLRDALGLEAIGTLGFRGEALAAIAAVSRIELITREPGTDEGVCLNLEAGDVVNMSPVGCPEGTTIVVRDLFFNTPARLKFMKSDRAEGSAVASVVLRCALSRPDVSIRFIKDGKVEYHTPGDSRVDSCVYSLLGREVEAGFLSAESSDEVVSTQGFVSSQAASRGNRSYQFFFVNGRAIRSLLLQSALEQAYKNTLSAGRFPSCVLYINVRPSDVDVNVHPAKTEIKFISDKSVFDSVYYAAVGALERVDAIGGIIDNDFRSSFVSEPSRLYTSSTRNSQENTVSVSRLPISKKTVFDNPNQTNSELIAFSSELRTPAFRVIGEALNVYIIVEYHNSVWFIDKHAAHERLHFDALKNSDYVPMSESLITPVVCRLGHEEVSVLLENAEFLDKLGFSAERFGEDSIAIRHIPADIEISETESILSEISSQLGNNGIIESSNLDKIYKTIACKAAIKAGRSSDSRELESLAAKVMSGEVANCPHGRPVAFEITKTALDKGFGRI